MSTWFMDLLDEFERLPVRTERLPTLMEVAGYPHYENVCSNILAFFFDPERPHGLGTLFLDAIARTGGIQGQEGTIGSNVLVDREVTTDAGNRVDILIQSDSHTILIENKIFAGVANPFDDYAAYLNSLQPIERHRYKFLLTLAPSSDGVEYGFQNITHGQLVSEIRMLLGYYVARADTRYLTFMLDFLNTLDNLQVGTVMDKTFLDFLASRHSDVEAFLNEIKKFRDELRTKVAELATLIDIKAYSNVRQWLWREGGSLIDILVHDIKLAPDLPVAIDTIVSPGGWEVQIFVRRGGDRTKLRNLLQRLEIPFEEGERFIFPTRFRYAEKLDQMHPVVRELVFKIADSGNAAELESSPSSERSS